MDNRKAREFRPFEIMRYQRMMKIIWFDNVQNEEDLRPVREKRRFLQNITRRRRTRLVGHILRHPELVNLIMEVNTEKENCRGRQMLEYIKTL